MDRTWNGPIFHPVDCWVESKKSVWISFCLYFKFSPTEIFWKCFCQNKLTIMLYKRQKNFTLYFTPFFLYSFLYTSWVLDTSGWYWHLILMIWKLHLIIMEQRGVIMKYMCIIKVHIIKTNWHTVNLTNMFYFRFGLTMILLVCSLVLGVF